MDRQEAIEKLSTIGHISVSYAEDLYDSFFPKPVVPQFVANWYEGNKVGFEFNLVDWINKLPLGIDDKGVTEFDEWLLDDDNKPIQTLVDMHRLGYTVEKEPRYTVKVKGIREGRNYLNLYRLSNKWAFDNDDTESVNFRVVHTRKELEKAGFGEVFDNPMFEVKEVE